MPGDQSPKEHIRVLNQIITFESAIHAIPFGEKLVEFMLHAIKTITKVNQCNICLQLLKKPLGNLNDEKCMKCNFFSNPGEYPCLLEGNKDIKIIPVATLFNQYACIVLKSSSLFPEPLLAALHNFSNTFAITIENHIQRSRLEKMNEELVLHRDNLEKQVDIRAGELKRQNEEYAALNEEYKAQNEKLISAKEKAEESDRLKSAFLTNMSHEIRTPMNGILGFANLLKKPKLSGEQQQIYISMILQSGDRMLNIINDLVDISKVESGQMETDVSEVNIIEQLKYVYDFFKSEAESKGLHLSCFNEFKQKKIIIITDKEKLLRILTNLIKNAIKFTNRGSIEFGFKLHENFIEFIVKDTGIGINKGEQKLIFNRFVQANSEISKNYEGAGLGLSITKAYIEMLGGDIRVYSRPNKGSTFYFTLPLREDINHEIENAFPKEDINTSFDWKDKQILIVEDDNTSRLLFKEAFKITKVKLIEARNGIEAIEICRRIPQLDLVLLDIKMPEMNGYEAISEIRKFNKKLPIIAQTAYALQGEKERCLNAGCDDFISKPINREDLILKVNKYLEYRHSR